MERVQNESKGEIWLSDWRRESQPVCVGVRSGTLGFLSLFDRRGAKPGLGYELVPKAA
jgi:hypothetical protein